MQILMLCPQVSGSSFAVSYLYGKALSKNHEVKFLGPLFGMKPFVEDAKLNIEFVEPPVKMPIQAGMAGLYFSNVSKLLKTQNDYDAIHTFKLLPNTAPVAAKIKEKTGKPFVLTIDDYDVASPSNPIKKLVLNWSANAYKKANVITTASTGLQKSYGGEVVYYSANEDIFDPKKHDGEEVRRKYGLENKIVVSHVGTLRPHKGVDDLINAVKKLNDPEVKLLLFERNSDKKYLEHCKKLSGPETIWIKDNTTWDVPEFLAATDVYVIPTKDTPYARAETPLKIFEAMAMGKAVVASDIGDMQIFLDEGNCGVLVKPDETDLLQKALGNLISNESLRHELGERARQHYLKKFGFSVLEKQLNGIYARL